VLGEKVRGVLERRVDRSLFIEPTEALLYRHVLTLTIKLRVSLAISYAASLYLVPYVNALAYCFKNVYRVEWISAGAKLFEHVRNLVPLIIGFKRPYNALIKRLYLTRSIR